MKILLLFLNLCALSAFAQTLPPTPKRPVVDTYFGKAVTDNYRWLEAMNSPETKAWFKAQGDYSNSVLDKIPGRNQLVDTFVAYDKLKPATIGEVISRGGHYFYRKTLPNEKVGRVFYRANLTAPEQVLFDPAAFDKSRTYSVGSFTPSEDGTLLTITMTEGGAEISTVRILNVATKTLLPDRIDKVLSFDVLGWSPDNNGFMYRKLSGDNPQIPQAHLNNRTLYHRIGTDPATDRDLFSRASYPALGIRSDEIPLVFYNGDQSMLFGLLATADRRWNGFIAPAADLTKPTIGWQRLATLADSIYDGLPTINNQLFLLSRKGASNGKVLVTDLKHPDLTKAIVLLPTGKQNITQLSASKEYLFVTLSDGINSQIKQYNVQAGQWADVPLPTTGTARLAPLDPRNNVCLLRMTSWKQPVTVYAYDPVAKQTQLSQFNVAANYPGLSDLVVEETEIPSHDGVMVPLSLIYKKGLKKDGSTVCFMTGYGAYGASAAPYFSTRYLAMLNLGVLVAVAHPRGGSEKGEDWHTGGYKTTKPNTWKDFIACGDYLVKNRYTSPAHLIGEGTSAGGILISRAVTDRPDLFAAAVCNVADCNALRSELGTDGPINAAEYGTVKDSTECMALYEMDGLRHVQDGVNYPAVIGVGGWNDPRVMVWQPGKFAAALQNASTSGKPVLMQVNYDNGHFTEDKAVTFRNFANMYTFALWQAGHPAFQPGGVQQTEMAGKK